MKRAALYLRSSKDRKDVSIHDQRRELTQLAQSRGLQVVSEYSDAVESGKDWDRPGFQALIRDIRNRGRGWDVVLVKDTARIARRRHLAMIFEEQECASHGVEVVYANVPDGDPATIMILRTLLQAMDEWHSLTSREKGLAGMAENVRRGFRGAGPAPMGYRLKRVDQGIVREGRAVTKSVLECSPDAPRVQKYLKLRAAGLPRSQSAERAGMICAKTTLVGIDWNALTYAGATTLHVFSERTESGAYRGGQKRRPRSEWMITWDTHEALITRDEAEAILTAMENSEIGAAVSRAKSGMSQYLLSGLLRTPAGELWEGNEGKYYRSPKGGGKRRYVPAGLVDGTVLDQLMADLQSAEFCDALASQIRDAAAPRPSGAIKDLQARIAEIAIHIDKAASLALQLEDPAPAVRKIDALERERRDLVRQQGELEEEAELASAVARITGNDLREILAGLADNIAAAPRDRLKATLAGFVQRVELDPQTLVCRIDFRVATNRVNVALPRGLEPRFSP